MPVACFQQSARTVCCSPRACIFSAYVARIIYNITLHLWFHRSNTMRPSQSGLLAVATALLLLSMPTPMAASGMDAYSKVGEGDACDSARAWCRRRVRACGRRTAVDAAVLLPSTDFLDRTHCLLPNLM